LRARCLAALLGLATLATQACATLGDVTPSCGNGVVDANEDCDQQKNANKSGNACGQPGSAGACRFICSSSAACPAGFGCGTDGICRAAQPLEFDEAPDVAIEGRAASLVTTDFNGDGVDDLLAVTAGSVDQHLFSGDRTSTPGTTIVVTRGSPSVGVLNHADSSSGSGGSGAGGSGAGGSSTSSSSSFDPPAVALSLSGGVSVFTSVSTDLTALAYAAVRANDVFSAASFRKPSVTGWTTGVVRYNGASLKVESRQGMGPMYPFPAGDAPVGQAISAQFLDGSPMLCTQLALGFHQPMNDHVSVFDPCSLKLLSSDVVLPPGVVLCGAGTPGMMPLPCATVTAFDVNEDEHVDLLAAGADGQLYVAYSDGKGSFYPTGTPTLSGPVNTFSLFAKLPAIGAMPQPLAITDLNGDCALDVVDATGVFLAAPGFCTAGTSNPPTFGLPSAAPSLGHTWSSALTGDVNGDGFIDVTVTDAGSTGLSVLRNAANAHFVPVEIPTFSLVKAAAVGDFDGDGVDDVAYAEQGQPATQDSSTLDAVSIAFGTRSGPPSDPVPLGQVTGVSQILRTPDLVASQIVTSVDLPTDPKSVPETNVYLFVGNTSREIVAPLLLLQDVQDSADLLNYDVPRRSAIGFFRGDPTDGDIAVFARPARSCTCHSRLWLLPTKGGAGDIDPTASACSTGAPCASKLMSPFDQADDVVLARFAPPSGPDQVVIAAPTGTKTTVAMAAVSGGAFALGTPTTLDFDITVPSGKLTEIDADMFTANVDGKGLDLVIASPTGGIAVLPWDPSANAFGAPIATASYTSPGSPGIFDACYGGPTSTGGPQPGPLPYPKPGVVPTLSKPALRAAGWPSQTFVDNQVAAGIAAPQQAIVVVTPAGVVLAEFDPSSAGSLRLTCLLTSQTDVTAPFFIGGSAVATGDYDGDGVDDIAISDDTGITLYYGKSYDPGAARAAADAGAGP
jgi:hypothetical protein